MTAPGKHELAVPETLALAAVGLEAEFTLIADGAPARPEDEFGDPRGFISGPLMHRVGTSYHLPNGTAVYFDTGVIEVATPAMELARGCMARAGRSLWESIALLRTELCRRGSRGIGFQLEPRGGTAVVARADAYGVWPRVFRRAG